MRDQDEFSQPYPLPDGSMHPEGGEAGGEWDRPPTGRPFFYSITGSIGFWLLAAGILYWVFVY